MQTMLQNTETLYFAHCYTAFISLLCRETEKGLS